MTLPPPFTQWTLRKTCFQLKDPIPRHEKNRVNSFDCEQCPAIYIGQTDVRFSNVFLNTLKQPKKSNFAKHIISESHSFDESLVSLLHAINKGSRLTAIEALEICKNLIDEDRVVSNEIYPFDSNDYSLNLIFSCFFSPSSFPVSSHVSTGQSS